MLIKFEHSRNCERRNIALAAEQCVLPGSTDLIGHDSHEQEVQLHFDGACDVASDCVELGATVWDGNRGFIGSSTQDCSTETSYVVEALALWHGLKWGK
ncbi:hypothetical protein ACLB2K_021921 [Fragaria x ananassa]